MIFLSEYDLFDELTIKKNTFTLQVETNKQLTC